LDCPETIRVNTKRLMIIHYAKCDYITWGRVPFSQKLNPLRYEITMNPKGWNQNAKSLTFNKRGNMDIKLSNLIFRLKKRLYV